MKFIAHSEINKEKWDALVAKTGDFYSYSWFLDACASEWMILVDGPNYENGIALNFTKKMGVSFLHPPMFVQTTAFLGKDVSFQVAALGLIQTTFPLGVLNLKQSIGEASFTRKTQFLSSEIRLNKLAKRMLNKATKAGLSIQQTEDWQAIYAIIGTELKVKIKEFTPANIERLKGLVQTTASKNQLRAFGIYSATNTLIGGLLFAEFEDGLYYIKGAATLEGKKEGAMYLCMHSAIEYALERNKMLDFGGSSVDGVRNFNLNFGADETEYYVYEWNHAPFWYKLVRKLYQMLKK